MAFLGTKPQFILEQENKTELTIALDELKDSDDDVLFNNVLEVLKKYCENSEEIYVLKNNGDFFKIHDYNADYYVVFSNKYQVNKFSPKNINYEKLPFIKVVEKLLYNTKIKGINLDRATSGLLIDTPKLLDKLFGTRDIYKLDIRNWGSGIPDYNSNQLMNPEMLLDFGLQTIGKYMRKEGYIIFHGTNRLDSSINIIASKNNKLYFVAIDSTVAPAIPKIENNRRIEILEKSYKFGATALYAPVSFGSTDAIRFDKSIALQGDSYYARFVGFEAIESQYS